MHWSQAKQAFTPVAPKREPDINGKYGRDYRGTSTKWPAQRTDLNADAFTGSSSDGVVQQVSGIEATEGWCPRTSQREKLGTGWPQMNLGGVDLPSQKLHAGYKGGRGVGEGRQYRQRDLVRSLLRGRLWVNAAVRQSSGRQKEQYECL